jgi:hypothetical protein
LICRNKTGVFEEVLFSFWLFFQFTMDIFPLSIIIAKIKNQKLHLISEHSVAEVAILLAVFFFFFLLFFCAGVLKFGSDDIRSRK